MIWLASSHCDVVDKLAVGSVRHGLDYVVCSLLCHVFVAVGQSPRVGDGFSLGVVG